MRDVCYVLSLEKYSRHTLFAIIRDIVTYRKDVYKRRHINTISKNNRTVILQVWSIRIEHTKNLFAKRGLLVQLLFFFFLLLFFYYCDFENIDILLSIYKWAAVKKK
ncbi:hypothetical protein FKM82_026690 [Ascaphus truei]